MNSTARMGHNNRSKMRRGVYRTIRHLDWAQAFKVSRRLQASCFDDDETWLSSSIKRSSSASAEYREKVGDGAADPLEPTSSRNAAFSAEELSMVDGYTDDPRRPFAWSRFGTIWVRESEGKQGGGNLEGCYGSPTQSDCVLLTCATLGRPRAAAHRDGQE